MDPNGRFKNNLLRGAPINEGPHGEMALHKTEINLHLSVRSPPPLLSLPQSVVTVWDYIMSSHSQPSGHHR